MALTQQMNKRVLLLTFKDGKIHYGSGNSKNDFVWHSYDIMTRKKQYIQDSRKYSSMDCFLFTK